MACHPTYHKDFIVKNNTTKSLVFFYNGRDENINKVDTIKIGESFLFLDIDYKEDKIYCNNDKLLWFNKLLVITLDSQLCKIDLERCTNWSKDEGGDGIYITMNLTLTQDDFY